MRKKRFWILNVLFLFVMLAGCAKQTSDRQEEVANTTTATPTSITTSEKTDIAKITEPVKVTEMPSATEEPTATEEPRATEIPKATEAPEASELPESTATPVPTEVPKREYPKADLSKGDITYRLDELKLLGSADVKQVMNADGSATLTFEQQYTQIRYALPEAIDSKECIGVSVNMDAEEVIINISVFGEGFIKNPWMNESYMGYVEVKDNLNVHGISIPDVGEVYGIGLMYGGIEAAGEPYVATVESITFHMLSGNPSRHVSKEIAPDVTESMTLKNTYGTVFGKIGTAVSITELRNPSILQLIKEQYNSITLGNETKQEELLTNPAVLISTDEAKKRGYVIPENYKETKVPQFDFSVLDESMKICADNGLGLRFHTLVNPGQCLEWFFREEFSETEDYVSPEVMDARMEFYIRTVMEHVYNSEYGYVVYAWDVTNEHLHAYMSNSPWVRVYQEPILEPRFAKLAYEIADDVLRKHGIRDKVSLIFNEYDVYRTVNGRYAAQDIILILAYFNSDKKICDGVGIQSHIWPEIPFDGKYKEALLAFLEAGYEVQITEADLQKGGQGNPTEEYEQYYCEFMKTLLEIARGGGKITGLTFWGMADNITGPREYTPFLFSYVGRPKDVYYKVLQTYVDPDYIVLREPVKLTYDCNELQYLTSYEMEYTINDDGSMDVEFQNQYGEIRFLVPEEIDANACMSIYVKMKSEYAGVSAKLYGKELLEDVYCPEIAAAWDCHGDGIQNYEMYFRLTEDVYGIGFMAPDSVDDFSKYKATVYSVSFYMEPGYTVE